MANEILQKGKLMIKLMKNDYEKNFGSGCISWQNIIASTPEKYMIKESGDNRRYRYVTAQEIVELMDKRLGGNSDGMRKKFIPKWKRTKAIASRLMEEE